MENNTENNQNNMEPANKCHCKKFIIIAIMTFLGSFLAFYFLMHQTMMFYFKTSLNHFFKSEHGYEKPILKDFDKINKFAKNEVNHFEQKVSAIQTIKNDDEYIIFIDLKKFHNDEKNINFDIKNNIVTITGSVFKNKNNMNNSYFFTESFYIPEKIDVENIKKEKIKNDYIITLPIEN